VYSENCRNAQLQDKVIYQYLWNLELSYQKGVTKFRDMHILKIAENVSCQIPALLLVREADE
jgi:hypothetical protein